jgi:hypothetical protein
LLAAHSTSQLQECRDTTETSVRGGSSFSIPKPLQVRWCGACAYLRTK